MRTMVTLNKKQCSYFLIFYIHFLLILFCYPASNFGIHSHSLTSIFLNNQLKNFNPIFLYSRNYTYSILQMQNLLLFLTIHLSLPECWDPLL